MDFVERNSTTTFPYLRKHPRAFFWGRRWCGWCALLGEDAAPRRKEARLAQKAQECKKKKRVCRSGERAPAARPRTSPARASACGSKECQKKRVWRSGERAGSARLQHVLLHAVARVAVGLLFDAPPARVQHPAGRFGGAKANAFFSSPQVPPAGSSPLPPAARAVARV